MHYTDQISWVLFLKLLADLEESKSEDAEFDGEKYTYILDEKYRWQNWAVLKVDEKKDIINNLSNIKLVIYLSF
uniref:type I restriction-modification system subunit M N-terminal domain-containing protein n=1 Tax=Aliarcobacter butzleri TaxID=28197 RepID=UPI0037095FCB